MCVRVCVSVSVCACVCECRKLLYGSSYHGLSERDAIPNNLCSLSLLRNQINRPDGHYTHVSTHICTHTHTHEHSAVSSNTLPVRREAAGCSHATWTGILLKRAAKKPKFQPFSATSSKKESCWCNTVPLKNVMLQAMCHQNSQQHQFAYGRPT